MTFIVQALEMFGTPETTMRHLKRSNHPLEATYAGMLRRCYNPNEKLYPRYGGRGLVVCERWKQPYGRGFANFVEDMGEKPHGMSLDRRDNDGNYEPSNCRWADRTTQNRNRSISKYVDIKGERVFLGELAIKRGVNRSTIDARIKRGIPIDEALSPDNLHDNAYHRARKAKKEGR